MWNARGMVNPHILAHVLMSLKFHPELHILCCSSLNREHNFDQEVWVWFLEDQDELEKLFSTMVAPERWPSPDPRQEHRYWLPPEWRWIYCCCHHWQAAWTTTVKSPKADHTLKSGDHSCPRWMIRVWNTVGTTSTCLWCNSGQLLQLQRKQ